MSRLIWITGEQISSLEYAVKKLKAERGKLKSRLTQYHNEDRDTFKRREEREIQSHDHYLNLEIARIQDVIDTAKKTRPIVPDEKKKR